MIKYRMTEKRRKTKKIMSKTIIYSARHGETDFNVQFCLCGRLDIPLTEKGIEQAHILAESLTDKGIEKIYCSDLCRAVVTAEIVGKKLGLQPIPDARLRETAFGTMECRKRNDPEYLRRSQSFAERFPEGESILQSAHRVYGFLDEIIRDNQGKTLLLVSHGWTNKMIASYFRDMTNEEFGSFVLPNCKLAQYEVE